MKIDKTLDFFEGKIDTRKKLNRANKTVPEHILKSIETGVTIETIEQISKELQLPVYKYQTQITIHGLFPELQNNWTFGYKNLFQNKNKSIGVKWNAIDENKRQQIKKYLKFAGFYYYRNSTTHQFQITKRVTEETFKTIYEDLKVILSKIDKSLFYGSAGIYAMVGMFGEKYLRLAIVIDAIYENNIAILLNKMGYTETWLNEQKEIAQKEEDKRNKEYEEKRKKEEELKKQAFDLVASDIKFLNENYTKVTTNESGLYIRPEYLSYENKVIFQVYKIYKEGRQKFPRITSRQFDNIKDALNCEDINSSFSDSIFKGKKTVYQINKTEVQKETKKTETKTNNSSVYIVSYSDKAIAVFGDTKPIKDKLKSLGCRFNAYLTYQDKKQAGWIAPVTQKEKIQAII